MFPEPKFCLLPLLHRWALRAQACSRQILLADKFLPQARSLAEHGTLGRHLSSLCLVLSLELSTHARISGAVGNRETNDK